MRVRHWTRALTLGGAWLLCAGSTHATLLMYENFGHTPSTNLVGKTPSGETSAWAEDASGTALTLAGGDLSAPSGLQASSGNRVQIPASTGHQSAQVAYDVTGSNDIFYSFLVRLDNVSSVSTTFATLVRVESAGATNGAAVFVRQNGSNSDQFDLGIHKRANAGAAETTASIQALGEGSVYFIVARYNTNGAGTDSMDLWLNPSSGTFAGVTPPTPTFSSTLGTDNTALWNTFVIDPPNGSAQGFFDELRVGTTWASVTPVIPEPASWALVALAGVCLMPRRRA